MGCDIHVFVEKRRDEALPWQLDDQHYIEELDEGEEIPYINSFPDAHDRDYQLFYALAGVRYGPVEPLYDDRGTPDDSCDDIKKQVERYGCDGHSHSWVTPAEFRHVLEILGYQAYPQSGYWKMVKYLEDWIEQEAVEAMLLKHDIAPEARIVFFFDN